MKKLIFGCSLMITGIIGFVGCLIADISLVQPGAWGGFFNVFDFTEIETYILLAFLAVSLVGAYVAIEAIRDDT